MSRTRTRSVLATMMVATVVIAACSGDDDSSDSADEATTVPTTEASSTEVTTEAPTEPSAPETAAPDTAPANQTSSAAVALPTEPMADDITAVIDQGAMTLLEQQFPELPGMWIGIWDPANGVHVAAYGDAEDGVTEATVDDVGRIGSITKTFTATAILELVADGSLSLDDTIADVLPDLAAEAPEIADVTVEALLSMRSGLPEYEFRVVPEIVANPTEVVDLHEVILTTVSEQGLVPVDDGTYSTANFLILGEMLEAVTGQPAEDVVNAVVAEAGLENAALQPPDAFGMPEPASHGYVNSPAADSLQDQGVDVEPLGDVSDYTAGWGGTGGSMYATVEDLGRWAATDFGNAFLPPDLVARRLETAPIDLGIDYGLGILEFPGGWRGHSGEILGWSSIALYQPDTGAVFAAIVNESGSLEAPIDLAVGVMPDLAVAFS